MMNVLILAALISAAPYNTDAYHFSDDDIDNDFSCLHMSIIMKNWLEKHGYEPVYLYVEYETDGHLYLYEKVTGTYIECTTKEMVPQYTDGVSSFCIYDFAGTTKDFGWNISDEVIENA